MIVVDNLVKRYRGGDRNAVDGISFSVEAGEFFALLGPNGAGKTTTISILTTTLKPTSGRVTIAGHDIERESSAVRSSVGIVFQAPSLDLNLTAEENVRFHATLYGLYPFRPVFRMMPSQYRAQVAELAGILGIGGDMYRPVKGFSGGMKRKLEILRSLVHRPTVLFLDEPTSGLDPDSRRNLWEYLKRVRRESGTTVFVTTHYIEEAEGADRICIVDDGRIVSIGSPTDVKAHLVQEYVVVDAADRDALLAELGQKGLRGEVAERVLVRLDGLTSQQVIQRITTPLTYLQIHAPSLEDAYLSVVAKTPE